jgi:hypothetical protein
MVGASEVCKRVRLGSMARARGSQDSDDGASAVEYFSQSCVLMRVLAARRCAGPRGHRRETRESPYRARRRPTWLKITHRALATGSGTNRTRNLPTRTRNINASSRPCAGSPRDGPRRDPPRPCGRVRASALGAASQRSRLSRSLRTSPDCGNCGYESELRISEKQSLSRRLAESEGFEPPLGCPKPDFESGAFDHSANSPRVRDYTRARGGLPTSKRANKYGDRSPREPLRRSGGTTTFLAISWSMPASPSPRMRRWRPWTSAPFAA